MLACRGEGTSLLNSTSYFQSNLVKPGCTKDDALPFPPTEKHVGVHAAAIMPPLLLEMWLSVHH